MSTVLTYNHDTSITNGFIGYMHSTTNSRLIETLKATAHHASHPLLLPVVALDAWVDVLRQDSFRCDNKVRDMQTETGKVENIYDRSIQETSKQQKGKLLTVEPDYEVLHSQVVHLHNGIASSMAHFVRCLGDDIANALNTFSSMNLGPIELLAESTSSFHDLVQQLKMEIRGLNHMRERISARLDMQAKVVSIFCLGP